MTTQNLTNNTFVKYTEASLNRLMADRVSIVTDMDNDVELIADAAVEMKDINAVLSLFDIARENQIEFTAKTTGIQLIESVSGKKWVDVKKSPSLGEMTSKAAVNGADKLATGLNRFGVWLADKTKKA